LRGLLVETTGLVKQAIRDGKSLADVKAAGLPDKYKSWGGASSTRADGWRLATTVSLRSLEAISRRATTAGGSDWQRLGRARERFGHCVGGHA
jgi:hypothetical protein